MRTLMMGVVGVVALTLAGAAMATPVDSNSVINDGIEYYFQTDKAVYELGENVVMLYRVTNLTDANVTFEFTCGPVEDRCDYIIEKEGERIWDNLHRPATMVLTGFTLIPLESRVFTYNWNMTNLGGNQITTGNYDVTGSLVRHVQQDGASVKVVLSAPVSVQIRIIPEPTIEADVKINPSTVNLTSKAKWIKCHIRLPDEYDADDVDPNSMFLERSIQPVWKWSDERHRIVIVKFARSEVDELLEPGEMDLTITGQLYDGTVFEGSSTITVIDKGGKSN